ncbi:5'-methylthioadenosine/adenosylhomocysteine nucleosidase [Neisseria leonii]|uniref:5'-methylthioadenosine/S-adenosylhomocysteine nucleosidase n=1 Tax=Neisseria leonii TaxID=2995413 RepID=A0A9X4E077_9NEIS|nr:5'-methylthioadenosine/adenosylhomocysteine nucleosidase [Neisseria sp. 51.81]MDD9326991.1 5'-methylthioadenosine/adenosylhomocysteine nucleosidase [Neisseria sp. 51.81]
MMMKTVGIIGAMQPEIELLKGRLKNRETHRFGAFEIDTGELGGCRAVLSLSGIGKVNAAVATALLVRHFSPDCIINTGSAGGLGSGLKVGDVVVGVQTAHHDVDVTAFGYAPGQVPQLPPVFASDADLVAAAGQAAAAFDGAAVHFGQIVSGDQFIHSTEKSDRLRALFPGALAVEMEAAAIAQTCAQLDVPFVVVRALSDTADEQAEVSFDEFLQQAGRRSAQMVEAMIAALAQRGGDGG